MKQLLYGCITMLSGMLYGQYHVQGTVYTPEHTPLEGCHIHHAQSCTVTNASGHYHIGNLPVGKHLLSFSYIGYQTLDTLVNVQQNVDLILSLKSIKTQLKEVSVSASTIRIAKIEQQKIGTQVLEQQSEKSLAEVLQNVAGVSVIKSGSNINKPVINGLHSSRVPVVLSGIRMEDQQWGAEHAPNVAVTATDKITVLKGVHTLPYTNDAFGGMVLLESQPLYVDTLQVMSLLQYIANGQGGMLSGKVAHKKGNWQYKTSVMGKYMGDRKTPDYFLTNTGNREYNVMGWAEYSLKQWRFSAMVNAYKALLGILKASHIGNATDLYTAIQTQQPYTTQTFSYTLNQPKQSTEHQMLKLASQYQQNSQLWEFVYSYQHNNRKEYDIRRGDYKNTPALDLTLQTHSLQMLFSEKAEDQLLKVGISGLFQDNFANPETDIQPLIPTYQKYEGGLFAVYQRKLPYRWQVEGGIRYDYMYQQASQFYKKSVWSARGYEQFQHFVVGEINNQYWVKPTYRFHNLTGALATEKNWEGNWNAKLSILFQARNPNPSELFSNGLHHATGMVEYGYLGLAQEFSTRISLGLAKQWHNGSVVVSPFWNSINHFMYLKPTGFETTIRGTFPVWNYQSTQALLMGIDISADWQLSKHWAYEATLGYTQGTNRTDNVPLIDMPPLNIKQQLLYAVAQGLEFSLQHYAVVTQHRYPDYDFETQVLDTNGNPVLVQVPISKPPKGYGLWTFRTDYKPWKNLDFWIGISVENMTNVTYRDYLNRQRFFADETGRNFTCQLKWKY